MKRYRVEIASGAVKQLERLSALSAKDFRRIDRLILSLEEEPRPSSCKKLQGYEGNIYRLRQGFYRIIYQVDDSSDAVRILRVMHRRDVYR
jgi:mRNA interferase RelE/StbE